MTQVKSLTGHANPAAPPFRSSIIPAGYAEKAKQSVADLPSGMCLAPRYIGSIDGSVETRYDLSGSSCRNESEATLRELYTKCVGITAKVGAPSHCE